MLSDNDLERLSAYIDGALSESERAALESRLAHDAELRRELQRLRATVELVNALPTLTAPRNFLLMPHMVRRPPTILTSAAFSALSAAAAVVLLIVGAALFTTSMRVPPGNLTANQVALAPTALVVNPQVEADEAARQQAAGGGTLAMPSPQPTQERPRELLQAPTETEMSPEMQLYAAPENATLVEAADNFAGVAADAALSQQESEDSEALQPAAVAPAETMQVLRMAEPSQVPASAASGLAEAQPLSPGEAPLLAQAPSETAVSALSATITPSATPTVIPTETPALAPSPTVTAVPSDVFNSSGSMGIGTGLIILAFVLLLAAAVTTILRRRA